MWPCLCGNKETVLVPLLLDMNVCNVQYAVIDIIGQGRLRWDTRFVGDLSILIKYLFKAYILLGDKNKIISHSLKMVYICTM